MNIPPEGTDIIYALFAGASANFVISLIVGLFSLTEVFPDAISEHDQVISAMLSTGSLLPTFIGIGLVAPIAEEILFRGIVSFELKRFLPAGATVIIQGIIFGLVHMIPMQIAYSIPYGIYFGFLAHRTGSLWVSIAAHIAMNSVAVLLTAPGILESMVNNAGAAMIYTGGSLIMFVSSLIYFLRKKPHHQA
jgi:membrane protease YdiL (CAAX protease family)